MNEYAIFSIGLLAQIMFSARILVQWIASERAHKVLSPVLFWQLSMVASFLLCLYGWLRNDFAIIVGQLAAYYIYIWNLNSKGSWKKMNIILRWVFILVPVLALGWFAINWEANLPKLFAQENIPVWLIVFGVTGQFIFAMRFIYQWLYSRKAGESLLPINFWLISLTGSTMIIIYALIRHDPILILGQCTGVIAYSRNIMIAMKYGNGQTGTDAASDR